MITDNSVLATVAEEQRGHLPTRGIPRGIDAIYTCRVPLCSTDEDDSCGSESDEHAQCVGLCFAADVSK
eukprot:3983874-Pyramimonas_sp.AAC.1